MTLAEAISYRRPRRPRLAAAARLIAVAIAALAACATLAPRALADGDPASDYLLGSQVFLAAQQTSETPAQRQLIVLVREANSKGFPIRVALVPTEYDLGSITALWHKPELYARFLGLELGLRPTQRLLVVMPNGYGFDWPGHSSSAVAKVLAASPIGTGADALPAAAEQTVRGLAAASGIKLSNPSGSSGSTGGSGSGGISAAVVAAILVALAAVAVIATVVVRRRRRQVDATGAAPAGRAPDETMTGSAAGSGAPAADAAPAVAAASTDPANPAKTRFPVWVVPAMVLACGAAVLAPIAVIRLARGSSSENTSTIVTPPPISWRAGARPAPNFTLTDQAGRPVSIAALRGRPVILTFTDPLCRNLCPLAAQTLNHVVSQMPAAKRPAIVAVSVDVWANTRADLLQDVRKWQLVPQWHWAVGSPAALKKVWKQYEIEVAVVTKRIASTKIHYITHTEAAYVIDPSGHERALFLWPFYPQDVEKILRNVT